MLPLTAFLFLLFCTVAQGSTEFKDDSQHVIPTPFGYLPPQCVHQVPNNAHLDPTTEGVRVYLSSEAKLAGSPFLYLIPEDKVCTEYMKSLGNGTLAHPRKSRATRGLSKDGWLDNAYWTLSSGTATSFSANYGVPSHPAVTSTNHVLYYFIGAVNWNINETILQPVLSWYGHLGTWSFTSWNCCPSGQANYATAIPNIPDGSTLFGEITIDTGTSTVISTWNNQHSTLSVATRNRIFNWLDATLETYSVTSCPMYAAGPMTFSELKFQLSDGSSPNPSWKLTAATECGGSIVVNSPFNIVIQHHP